MLARTPTSTILALTLNQGFWHSKQQLENIFTSKQKNPFCLQIKVAHKFLITFHLMQFTLTQISYKWLYKVYGCYQLQMADYQ